MGHPQVRRRIWLDGGPIVAPLLETWHPLVSAGPGRFWPTSGGIGPALVGRTGTAVGSERRLTSRLPQRSSKTADSFSVSSRLGWLGR